MAKKPAPMPKKAAPKPVGVVGIADANGNPIRHESSVRSGDDDA